MLPVRRGHRDDAEIDGIAAERRRRAALLRRLPIREVEPSEGLQPACDGRLGVRGHGGELADDAVDAHTDRELIGAWLEVDVGRALVEGLRQQRVDEVDRRPAGRKIGVALPVGENLQRRPVEARQRTLDLRADGYGQPEARAERKPEVVGDRDVRRVADGEQEDAVGEEADRDRLVAVREGFGKLRDGRGIGRHGVEVDELELVLLRQRARDHLGGGKVQLDHDLAEAPARRLLDGERLLELLARDDACLDEEAAKGNPVEVGRRAQHHRSIGTGAPGLQASRSRRNTTGASREAPVKPFRTSRCSEKPDEQEDDDDERQKSATDVHASLLVACAEKTARGRNRLRLPLAWALAAPWPSG